jgi:DNA-binding NarL/FixJ family response regulator
MRQTSRDEFHCGRRKLSSASNEILVVDDDASFRRLVSDVLERAGYTVCLAATGEEALECVRESVPRLVILDVNLPGTSGYSVCNELRNSVGHHLPIIFVSGDRTESFDRVAGLLIGADDYLAKPFDPEELVARIERMLTRSDYRRPRRRETDTFGLTPREHEVLGLLVDGLSQPEIAERLYLSPKTVGTHIQRILGKMGVGSRTQAVALAAREGLVEAHRAIAEPAAS